MSEYNIQMNKYNALNAEYDQLYPATKIANVDGLDTALQKKADTSSVYSKEESISASTRTALSLPDTATPDNALSEIARQLSESGGVQMTLLWENADDSSTFANQDIVFDAYYQNFIIEFKPYHAFSARAISVIRGKNIENKLMGIIGSEGEFGGKILACVRNVVISETGATFHNGYWVKGDANFVIEDGVIIPTRIFGF